MKMPWSEKHRFFSLWVTLCCIARCKNINTHIFFSHCCWIWKSTVLPKQMVAGISEANFGQRVKKASFTSRWLGSWAFSLVRAPPGTGHPSVTPAYPQSFCCFVECQAGRRSCRVFLFFSRWTVSLIGFSLKKRDLTTGYFTDEGACLLKLQRGENVEGFSW